MLLMLALFDHLFSEAARYVVVIDFCLMFACGAAVWHDYRHEVPKVLHHLAGLFGMVFLMVTASTIVNIVFADAQTPGVKVLAVTASFVTAGIAFFAARALLPDH